MVKLIIGSWALVRSAIIVLPLHLIAVRAHSFRQTICLPVGPRCDLCELNTKGPERCPSAQKVVNPRNRKTVVMSEVVNTDSGPKVEIEIEEATIPGTPTTFTANLESDMNANREDMAKV